MVTETVSTEQGESEITLPYKFEPREYQKPVMDAVTLGYKRIACPWHRRAGKDKTFFNILVREMFRRVGGYYYFFPTGMQGRRALWEAIDRDGFPMLGHFPPELIRRKHDTDMLIDATNGSYFRVIGTDNFDKSSIGTGAVGMIFSEYSIQTPNAWQYMQPIMIENDGWALFNWTPRGKNHAHDLHFKIAAQNPGTWFLSALTIDDTGAVTPEQVEQARRDGMTQDMIDQEFYLSYEAANPGAYFREEMLAVKNQGRICKVPVETTLPVYTFWDLGVGDSMTIWLVQFLGKECRAIGYYENSGLGLAHYIAWLRQWAQDHQASFDTHVLPHDGEVREMTSSTSTGEAKSRKQTLQEARIGKVVCTKRPATKEDGIEASRQMIPRTWFDSERCDEGIEALRNYRKEAHEKYPGVFKCQPVHDIHAHGADGFQTLAIWYPAHIKKLNTGSPPPPKPARRHYKQRGSGWMGA